MMSIGWECASGTKHAMIMKKLLLLLLLALPHTQAGPILKWDYPTPLLSTALTFRVYFSDLPTVPLTNWVLLVTVPGTNTSTPVTITPINRYYAVQTSNVWGAVFSTVVLSPAALLTNVNLQLVP
jgi:hypothetical protein